MRYIGYNKSTGISTGGPFYAGNKSSDTVYDFLKDMGGTLGAASGVWSLDDIYNHSKSDNWKFPAEASAQSPTSGGTMTINSQTVASGYDYTVHTGDVTVSSFSNSDFFTTTDDSKIACVHVTGDLTINSGQTFIPSNRKPGMYVYVGGDLTLNGSVSMKGRGADATSLTTVAIKLIDGTHGTYDDCTIPATGGVGGASGTSPSGSNQQFYSAYSHILRFASGGAQHGIAYSEYTTAGAGKGADGTCYGGGGGGGSARGASPGSNPGSGGNAVEKGGKGGNAACSYYGASGSAGNPAGNACSGPHATGGQCSDGVGGMIVFFVRGQVSGSGSFNVRGENSGAGSGGSGPGRGPGQGSSAGMIACFCGSNPSSVSLQRENGGLVENSGTLTGVGTDWTTSGVSGAPWQETQTNNFGGTPGGFGQIIATTLS